jgi:imidazolonepropionase-like amidohydrolase
MTPAEILQSATSVAATVLGQSGRLGVIAKGAVADLIVLDGDPTADLAALTVPGRGPRAVMKAGRFVDLPQTRRG